MYSTYGFVMEDDIDTPAESLSEPGTSIDICMSSTVQVISGLLAGSLPRSLPGNSISVSLSLFCRLKMMLLFPNAGFHKQ